MADVFAAALAEAPDPNAEVTVRSLIPPPTSSPTDPAPPGPDLVPKAASAEAPPPDAPDPLATTMVSDPPDPLAVTRVSAPPVAAGAASASSPAPSEDGASVPDPFPAAVSVPLSSAAVAPEPAITEPPPPVPEPQPLKSAEAFSKPPTPKPPNAKPATPKPPTPKPAIAATLRSAEPRPPDPPAEPEPAALKAMPAGDTLWRTIALGVVAFGATFVFVRWGVVPALAPSEAVEPTPAPSAIVAAVRASAAPVAAGPAMNVKELDLPEGFDPGVGRGLLEVATAAADSIYVDGTFVGRGPGRSVPAAGGRHEVKIVRADAEHTTFVELKAGRRLRVGLELEAPAAPRP
jgi:hypothetical protein